MTGTGKATWETDREWGGAFGNRKTDILQFTAEGRAAGIFPLDINAFAGTREELEALTGGDVAKPPPEAEEDGEQQVPAVSWPPHPGATKNSADKTAAAAKELEEKFPVVCSTYHGHGRTGEAWGIDVWIGQRGVRADQQQEALGDRIQERLEANWNSVEINYVIWWNWMKENADTP